MFLVTNKRGEKMKQTPEDKEIQKRMQPGALTVDGFLGSDKRHFHDIIEEDKNGLQKSGISEHDIADRMQFFTDKAFENYEDKTIIDNKYKVEFITVRGKILCPFRHPCGFSKGIIKFKNIEKNISLTWTPLNIHLIREHCFFEGKDSKFRLEPEILKKALFS